MYYSIFLKISYYYFSAIVIHHSYQCIGRNFCHVLKSNACVVNSTF